MQRTLLITAVVTLVLAGLLGWVREPARWPAPEVPPHQGEAAMITGGGVTHAPAALARLVREPQNAWSNLAFVVGGAFMIATALTQAGRAVGVVLLGVAGGSFVYHASAAEALRHFDVGAMYWLFLVTTALCLAAVQPRWRGELERRAAAIFVVALPVALLVTAMRHVTLLGIRPLSLRLATALAMGVTILSLAAVARRRESPGLALQFLGIVTLFGVAAACQTGDRPGGRLFAPGALVQAHAVWHVLAAIAFGWAVRILDAAAAGRLPAPAEATPGGGGTARGTREQVR